MAVQGTFIGLPLAVLTTLMTSYVSCLTQIAVAGQSYTIGQRTFTRANLAEVSDTIAELTAAINSANGTRIRRTRADFGGSAV